jgi:epoxyqueuosine reductase QueG
MGLNRIKNEKTKNTAQIQQYFIDYLEKVKYKGTFGIAEFSSVYNDLMPVQQSKLKEATKGRLKEFKDTGSIISLGIFYLAEIIDCINVQKNGVIDKERWDVYSDEYQHINEMLINISEELAQKYNGIAIPPTTEAMAKTINSVIEFYPHTISHRVVAEHAGAGWRGKSELIITETYGPAVRFTSILINIPLIYNKKIERRCGECTACLDVCSFLKNKGKLEDYRENCNSYLTSLGLKHHVCGKCIKACFRDSIYGEKFRLAE